MNKYKEMKKKKRNVYIKKRNPKLHIINDKLSTSMKFTIQGKNWKITKEKPVTHNLSLVAVLILIVNKLPYKEAQIFYLYSLFPRNDAEFSQRA